MIDDDPAARAVAATPPGGHERVNRVPTPDDQLLALVARADPAALAELYDRHCTMAYAVALRITRSVPAAEDVVQDAFLGVWRNADRFDAARGTARSWLLAIVHHRAIDAVRRRRLTVELPDPEAGPPPVLVGPDLWPEIAARVDASALRAALRHLPDVQREAIELSYWEGLTQREVAERTATPLGTIKSRVRLGLLALRRELAGGFEGHGPTADPPVDPATGSQIAADDALLRASVRRFALGAPPTILALLARVRPGQWITRIGGAR